MNHRKHKAKQIKDPEFRAVREALEAEHQHRRALIKRRQLWMDDIEMAIDAYQVWLETKYEADGDEGVREALEAFNTFFGEEDNEMAEGYAKMAGKIKFCPHCGTALGIEEKK